MHAGVLVGDGGLARAPGHVVHQHGSRLGDRLEARSRVHRVSEHHGLGVGATLHRSGSGEHPRAHAQLGHTHLLTEGGYRLRECKGGADGALGVVLACHGRSPHRHDGVADELLNRAAMALYQRAAAVEVPRQQLSNFLRVAMLGERREAHQVREEHGHQAALRVHGGRYVGWSGRRGRGERCAARTAEMVAGLVLSAAAGAEDLQSGAALRTEAPAAAVIGTAGGAVHVSSTPALMRVGT